MIIVRHEMKSLHSLWPEMLERAGGPNGKLYSARCACGSYTGPWRGHSAEARDDVHQHISIEANKKNKGNPKFWSVYLLPAWDSPRTVPWDVYDVSQWEWVTRTEWWIVERVMMRTATIGGTPWISVLNPHEGDLHYDTTLSQLWYYNSSIEEWRPLGEPRPIPQFMTDRLASSA